MDLAPLKPYWREALILVLIVALLLTGRSYEKKVTQERKSKETAEEQLKLVQVKLTTLEKTLKRRIERTSKPVEVAGTVAYETREVDVSEETTKMLDAMSAELEQSRLQRRELEEKLESVTKSAPRWMAGLGMTAQRFDAGLGINLGPLTISAWHPIALTLEPRGQIEMRF